MSVRQLAPADAPRLIAITSDLAIALAPDASFSIARGTPTLGIGLLALLDVPELNALLAREKALREDHRFWKRLTRAGIRDRSLAADARIADGAALAGAIAKVALAPRLFRAYLDANVALAIDHGALPADIAEGFVLFARRFAERGVTAGLRATIDTAAADPNGEPGAGERLRALPAPAAVTDARALDLLAFDHEAWLCAEIRERFGTTAPLVAWAEIPGRILAPSLRARGEAVAARLANVVPDATFATIHDALAAGRGDEVAIALEPRLATAKDAVLVAEALAHALVPLLSAALLARGATITGMLGEESPRFRFRDETVSPLVLVLGAMAQGPAVPGLATWAAALR